MSGKGIWRFKGGAFGLCSCFFLPENKRTVAFLRRSNINRSQSHKGRMDNNVASSFQHLTILTSREREEEAPGNEVA